MTAKFRNRYRVESHRHPTWDYSGNGMYFITFVTQGMVCNLGRVEAGTVILSDFGRIADYEWLESFQIRSELFLDEYKIMPNHIHGLIEIKKIGAHGAGMGAHGTQIGARGTQIQTHGRASLLRAIPPQNPADSMAITPIPRNPPIRLPRSISSFIAGFKSAVNTKIDDYIDAHHLNIPKYNRRNHFFQPNYHDHIVRNHAEYLRIKNYIRNNPIKWENDKLHGRK